MPNCPTCECPDLLEDEATGQLICIDCGAASGMYGGITQTPGFMDSRGLRVVASQPSQSASQNIASSQPLPASSLLAMSTLRNNSTMPPPMSTPLRASQLNHPGELSDDASINVTRTPRRRTKSKSLEINGVRPWRLSEPLTCVMRRQATDLASHLQLSDPLRERFLKTVEKLWFQYLAITGELGEKAWQSASIAHSQASLRLMQSIDPEALVNDSSSKAKKKLKRAQMSVNIGRTDTLAISRCHQYWRVVKDRLDHLQWIGWGLMYEPSEGRAPPNPLTPSPSNSITPRSSNKRRVVLKYFGGKNGQKRQQRQSSSTPKWLEEDESESDDDDDDDESSEYELAAQNLEMTQRLSMNQDAPELTPMSASELTNKLRRLTTEEGLKNSDWLKVLCDQIPRVSPWSRSFWRGQMGSSVRRGLLEYNLAVLFFANLAICPTRAAQNPFCMIVDENPSVRGKDAIASLAVTQMTTLHDLIELTRNNQIPFSAIGNCLPKGLFKNCDQNLAVFFRSDRKASMTMLTSAANRLFTYFGLYRLPKLPFFWLVQRHMIALDLPESLLFPSQLLLRRFRGRMTGLAVHFTDMQLLPLIPWPRLLRIEVIAMAFVIILLRSLFKFDDISEYRLSHVASTLASSGTPSTPQSTHPHGAAHDQPTLFNWLSWTAHINARYSLTGKTGSKLGSIRSVATPNAADETMKRDSAVPSPLSTNTPVNNTATGDELNGHLSCSDLLGSSEFRADETVGWGESCMNSTMFAKPEKKLSYSEPLRDVIFESERRQQTTPRESPSNVLETRASSFRLASIDFLLNGEPNLSKLAPTTDDAERVVNWWRQLIDRRSVYQYICTGCWSFQSIKQSSWKHRYARWQTIQLPRSVERLIREHDEELSAALQQTSIDSNDTTQPSKTPDPTTTTTQQNGKSPLSANRTQPSQSMRWLIGLCAVVCGAENHQQLLREVGCLEELFFDRTCISDEKLIPADIALYSSMDFNYQPL